jgi:hypothetical protein
MKKRYLSAAVLLLVITMLASCAPREANRAPGEITSDEVLSAYLEFSPLPRSGAQYPAAIHAYITEHMKTLGIKTKADKYGNLMAFIPATERYKEEKPLIVLCNTYGKIEVAPDMVFDATNGGAAPVLSDDKKTVSADGTSMAAESALGIADALVAADRIIANEKNGTEHRAIRLLFTSDGAKGNSGITSVATDWLDGALLVSLDGAGTSRAGLSSEYVSVLESDTALTPAKTTVKYAYVIAVSDYFGGAFGTDKDFPNPLDALIEILAAVNNSGIHYNLCSIRGGDDALTAPKEATAILAMDDYEQKRFLQVFSDASKSLDNGTGSISITQTVVPEYSIADSDTSRVVTQLFSLSSSDFTAENENLSGVFIGSVDLSEGRFVCKAAVIGSDLETVDKVSGECDSIPLLSGIPIKRLQTLAGFSTPEDNDAVASFLKGYAAAAGAKIKTTSLGVSPLGIIPGKSPELPIVSIGVSVNQQGTPYEQVNFDDISAPANAIYDYVCA